MQGTKSFIFETAKVIVVAVVIVFPIRAWVFQPFLVKGDSMKPNFHNSDYLIIDELSYRLKSPERGQVIVFKYPGDLSQRYIKRIIGLPGETVEVKDNIVSISKGSEKMVLREPYIPQALTTLGSANITLKDGEYFVLGDNRPNSSDSRIWGVLPKKDIVGKVLVRVFPPNAFGLLQEPMY